MAKPNIWFLFSYQVIKVETLIMEQTIINFIQAILKAMNIALVCFKIIYLTDRRIRQNMYL